MEVLREGFINDGGRKVDHKLTSEIKELLNSIQHNAVNTVLARDREEYRSYVKAVEDSKEAVIALFQKLDREYQEEIERLRISQMEQILNLQKQLNENEQWFQKSYENVKDLEQQLQQVKDKVEYWRKLHRERANELERKCVEIQLLQNKVKRYEEIVRLFKIAFLNGDAEHRSINGRSVQAMSLLEELEGMK